MPHRRLIATLASGACLILAPTVSAHGNPHGGPPGHSGGTVPTPAPAPAPAPVAVPTPAPVVPTAPGNGHGHGHGNGNGNGVAQPVVAQTTQSTTTSASPSNGNGNSGSPGGPGNSGASHGNSANAPGHTKRTANAVSQTASSTTTTAAAAAVTTPAPAVTTPAPAATTPAPAATTPAPATTTPAPKPSGSGRARRSHAGSGRHRASGSSSRAGARTRTGSRRVASLSAARGGLAGGGAAGGLTGGTLASARISGARGGLLGGLSGKTSRQYSSGNVLAQMAGKRVNLVPALIGNLVPLPVPDWSKPIILLLLVVCLILAFRAWRSARKAHRLESKGRQLAADLDVMQAALVPAIPSRLGALRASVAYRPAEGPAAGGDFYDVFPLDGGRVAVIVGDVSGHGRAALARAAHMHYTLRAYVETGLDPRSSLKLAGRVLGNEGDGLFTTVAIAVYDPHDATLTYATAGHPAPVVIDNTVIEPVYGAASPALGWGLPTGLRQTTLPFSQGARACFFSDGVTEARTTDGLLGRERLAQLICEAGTGVSATQLLEHVRAGATAVNDDMAACLIEAGEGVAIMDRRFEELEVDSEQLAAGQGERFLRACGVNDADTILAVGRARDLAAEMGVALMRVEYTPEGRNVVVDGATSLVLATPSLGATGPDGEPAGVRNGDPAQWAGRALPLRT